MNSGRLIHFQHGQSKQKTPRPVVPIKEEGICADAQLGSPWAWKKPTLHQENQPEAVQLSCLRAVTSHPFFVPTRSLHELNDTTIVGGYLGI